MIKFQISADNCDGGIKPKCNFEMMQFLIKHEDDWLTGWLAGWSVFMEINSSFFQFQKLVFSLWCVSFLLRQFGQFDDDTIKLLFWLRSIWTTPECVILFALEILDSF